MKKDKSLNKLPRMANGVRFSSFKGIMQRSIEIFTSSISLLPGKTQKEKELVFYAKVAKKLEGKLNTSSAADLIADTSMLVRLSRKMWHSFYIMDSCAVDFLKNHQPTESEIEAIEVVCDELKEYENGIAIHMAGERHSIYCIVGDSQFVDSKSNFIGWKRNDDYGYCAFEPKFLGDHYKDDSSEPQVKETWRIICNLMLYMLAFPECIKQSPPPILKELRNGYNQTCVESSDKIKDCYGLKKNVSPHFRRGHIRILKHEKYKHKQFSAVYVKPTMVRGKAETIIYGATNA